MHLPICPKRMIFISASSGHMDNSEAEPTRVQDETVWVEGLVPGIDFCNHGMLLFFSSL